MYSSIGSVVTSPETTTPLLETIVTAVLSLSLLLCHPAMELSFWFVIKLYTGRTEAIQKSEFSGPQEDG